jgi:hypothetical protein
MEYCQLRHTGPMPLSKVAQVSAIGGPLTTVVDLPAGVYILYMDSTGTFWDIRSEFTVSLVGVNYRSHSGQSSIYQVNIVTPGRTDFVLNCSADTCTGNAKLYGPLMIF